jgi:DNA replication protein DnaC
MRWWDAAGVPPRFQKCTLESYPRSEATLPAYQRLLRWARPPEGCTDAPAQACPVSGCHPEKCAFDVWFKGRRESVLLYGPFGTGKTGLGVGLLRDHIWRAELPGLFITCSELLESIRATYDRDSATSEQAVLDRVKRIPFLVLDDIGAERIHSDERGDWAREKLFSTINYRHGEDLATVFTSNLDPAELGDHLGERTTWRIIEMSLLVELDGPNLRAGRSA